MSRAKAIQQKERLQEKWITSQDTKIKVYTWLVIHEETREAVITKV
jgi:hypothetical protein